MDDFRRDLRDVLAREIDLHREILAFARTRNLLLIAGRHTELPALRRAEAGTVEELRALESLRGELAAGARDPAASAEIARATERIAGLLRQLGAVERANRVLLARAAVRPAAHDEGIGVWAGLPTN